jgi:threonine dehydrogenase-like Zn-dependent dehydrogenase
MKALTFHGPGDIRYEEVAEPRLEHADDAIVEVEVAGLCGSDLHPYCGRESGLDTGTVMGHEFVGEIIFLGDGVRGLSVGDRVVAPFSTSCGGCFFCETGLTSRCENGQLFGWVEKGDGLQGGQAERVRVPLAASSLVRLPDDLPSELALFAADILPTGLFAAELGEIGSGSFVAVVGCGPVGLMAVVAAALRGARRVVAVDSVADRLALAEALGAEPVDMSQVDPVETVLSLTKARGVDVVLEVVGLASAARLAVDLVRPGGTVATVGFHTDSQFAFSPGEIYDRNLTYRSGRCPARRFIEESLAILTARQASLRKLITHRVPLRDGARAYDLFSNKLESCVKVALRP